MKLTDFSILFGVLLFCIFVGNDLKIRLAEETLNSTLILNNNMDEIVVDGLRQGFTGVDKNDKKRVDLYAASERIFEEMSILFYGSKDMKTLVYEYVKAFIYVEEDGYFLYEKGKWSDKIAFEEGMEHSMKVEVISDIISNRTNEVPLISYNDGENYKNTIDDNTLIIAYCGYNFMTGKFVYKNSYLSAATIKLIED